MSSSEKHGARRWFLRAVVFAILFISGITAGYLFFMRGFLVQFERNRTEISPAEGDFTYLSVYYPFEGRLQMEQRRVPRAVSRVKAAEVTVKEFLKGPAGITESYVPENTRLLGIYPGEDGILYIDFSDEFRRNFQGDVLAEFLLLRGLYESLLSNVYGIDAVKVLVEGKEVESIGGHISLLKTLGDVVSQTVVEDEF